MEMWWRARYVAWREERRGVGVWGKIVWRAGKGGEVVVLGGRGCDVLGEGIGG